MKSGRGSGMRGLNAVVVEEEVEGVVEGGLMIDRHRSTTVMIEMDQEDLETQVGGLGVV
jgi:hypothetical protein